MWRRHKRKLLVLSAVFVAALTTGLGCRGGDRQVESALEQPVSLEFWGVFDTTDSYSTLITEYRRSRPNISIKYRKLRFEEYERELLEAWAEGRGPDIFMVHNTWVGGYTGKITSLPPTLKVPTVLSSGGLKREKVYSFEEKRTITPGEIRDKFISVVEADVVRDGLIYGLPLSADTMVLYYNRAMLDQAGVVAVPRTWQELKEAAMRLTEYNEDGTVARPGVALGGTNNINRSFDILSLLMAQNGTEFVDPGGFRTSFGNALKSSGYRPGQEALRFYTDFALPSKEVYSWSEDLPQAVELFTQGRLGLMLGYNYQLPLLKAQGPSISLGIAGAPHINADGTDATGQTINWANYWVLSAARQTEHVDEVWDFITFATTNHEQNKVYLEQTGKPAALRSLILEQISDPDLNVFASQLLSSMSWYRGTNALGAEAIFADMIRSVTFSLKTPEEAIKDAQRQVDATL